MKLMKAMLLLPFAVTCAGPAGSRPALQDSQPPLVQAAGGIDADELLVLRDGAVLMRWSSGRYEAPYQLMSVTKSVVGLALGKLVDEGKLGLSDRLDRFLVAWRGDPRGAITVQQVLEHTSGLGSSYPHDDLPDILEMAMRQPLEHLPGEHSFYNNDAVNLLSGIVEAIEGTSLEQYTRRVLFEPLGITRWSWYHDGRGHSWVMTGLALGPGDLAKLGQLILSEGRWAGRQVISREWIRHLSRPSAVSVGRSSLWKVGLDFPDDAPESLRSAAPRVVWGAGDHNQLLLVDPDSGTVVVLQTELLRREDRDRPPAPLANFLTQYCAWVGRLGAPSATAHGAR